MRCNLGIGFVPREMLVAVPELTGVYPLTLDAALALTGSEDAVCAWGSLYSVGELRHCLGLC